jgi:hypothetical protein
MFLQIDPTQLNKQSMLLHQREPGEYWVITAGLVVGRVSQYSSGDGDIFWLWYLTGPQNHNEDTCLFGDSRSLLAAKEALRSSLQACLENATRSNTPLKWLP